MALPIILLGLGLLLSLVGTIMLLVAAFRESVGWGLIVFFVPFGNLVYTCVHWAEAKASFLVSLLGGLIIGAGIMTLPNASKIVAQVLEGKVEPGNWLEQQPDPDLNTQIAEKRKTLEDLQATFVRYGQELPAQYQALEKRRNALKAGDEAAISKFNEDAASYQARNKQHKEIQQSIASTQAALDQLLDARSRAAAKHRSSSDGKQVVMYTTSSCPACKVAKQYMAQKGIPYQEIDVETSRDGMEAFRRLGGTGVPLITVGDQKMTGFNSQKFEQMRL